jgi:transposase
MMSTRQRGRVSKYTDDFKRKLVAESSADGVSVPMMAQRQGVPENRIYAWRGDPRFQPDDTDAPAFTPVGIADADIVDTPASSGTSILPVPSISFCSSVILNTNWNWIISFEYHEPRTTDFHDVEPRDCLPLRETAQKCPA